MNTYVLHMKLKLLHPGNYNSVDFGSNLFLQLFLSKRSKRIFKFPDLSDLPSIKVYVIQTCVMWHVKFAVLNAVSHYCNMVQSIFKLHDKPQRGLKEMHSFLLLLFWQQMIRDNKISTTVDNPSNWITSFWDPILFIMMCVLLILHLIARVGIAGLGRGDTWVVFRSFRMYNDW